MLGAKTLGKKMPAYVLVYNQSQAGKFRKYDLFINHINLRRVIIIHL